MFRSPSYDETLDVKANIMVKASPGPELAPHTYEIYVTHSMLDQGKKERLKSVMLELATSLEAALSNDGAKFTLTTDLLQPEHVKQRVEVALVKARDNQVYLTVVNVKPRTKICFDIYKKACQLELSIPYQHLEALEKQKLNTTLEDNIGGIVINDNGVSLVVTIPYAADVNSDQIMRNLREELSSTFEVTASYLETSSTTRPPKLELLRTTSTEMRRNGSRSDLGGALSPSPFSPSYSRSTSPRLSAMSLNGAGSPGSDISSSDKSRQLPRKQLS